MRISLSIVVQIAILASLIFIVSCEGSPDRSLAINAYPPLNQEAGKPRPVMQNVERIRLGVFEKIRDDYRTNTIYQFPQLIKDYYSCVAEYAKSGASATVTVNSCNHCVEGQCEAADSDDVPNLSDFTALCQQAAIQGDVSSKCVTTGDSGQNCVYLTSSGTDAGFCEFDYAVDETAIDTVDLSALPASETNAWTYVIEGFGRLDVESTTACTSGDVLDGWICQQNRQGLNVWVRSMPNAVVARGISSPAIYNGDDQASVDVYFSLVQQFGISTMPSTGAGEASLMTTGRSLHKALALPDGGALLIGGELTSGTNITHPAHADLYDYATSTFTQIDIQGWSGGRSHFTLNELDSAVVEDTEEEETSATVRFVITGGKKTAAGGSAVTGECYLATYDIAAQTLSMRAIGNGLTTPVYDHTATMLKDGRILIVGGKTAQESPSSEAWILDPVTSNIAAVGQLSKARFKHTATLMPNGNVIIVGGFTKEGNNTFTTNWVEVFDPEENGFSRYVYEEGENDQSIFTSRVGHIAVPLAARQQDGSVSVKDWEDARVAIYGGYRYTDEDVATGKYYYNIPPGLNDVSVAYIDQFGKVEVTSWTSDPGYRAAMTQGTAPSPHPAVESEWIWLGDSTDTILLIGGRRNNQEEYSDWAEIIKFEGGEGGGYAFGRFKFGPDGTYDRVDTPFRAALMTSGRWGSGVVQLDNGLIMITGGRTYRSRQTQTLNSAEIFNPPTHNRWGSVFKVKSEF